MAVKRMFKHQPLNLVAKQIRLVKVLPDLHDGLIQCRISIATIKDGEIPDYRALSYPWGSRSDQHKSYRTEPAASEDMSVETILVDGFEYRIGRNLHNFLGSHRRTLMARMQKYDQERRTVYSWIDQLCIDQENIRERNHQVQMMGEIYRGAGCVYVWLAGSDEAICKLRAHDQAWSAWHEASDSTLQKSRASWYIEHWKLLGDLCYHPYWFRTWIAQEFVSARHIQILCGDSQVSLDELIAWLQATGITMLSSFSPTAWLVEHAFNKPTLSYADLLYVFRHSDCTHPRDKIYGLLGLVPESIRIEVDYAAPIELVFLDVGRILILEKSDEDDASRKTAKNFTTIWSLVQLARQLELGAIERRILLMMPPGHPGETAQALISCCRLDTTTVWAGYGAQRCLDQDFAAISQAAECLILNLATGHLCSLFKNQAETGGTSTAGHVGNLADGNRTDAIDLEKYLFRYRDGTGKWWDSAYEAVLKHKIHDAQMELTAQPKEPSRELV